ncbi:MAG TPA: 3-oxoacyl-[acyl-carrier-protein] synthase III C-terminal domain-containing protein [Ramlibacter sp.]|jgi:3-oxoacyl-[acyl-carrier-protein] synthase-3|uniref:3-oxoacyl-[acyl-carrier-protein] synthase III C-terminal domain-containing protein n=1 Tax=Ramlibacter sp. TaxID=1917967 RepID=UPI002D3B3451|nr:3-oxoacyl-[acyl-carrier-protein] synthase III C-terminal domain-containing protein [Ramlibacter sp.]HZY19950.1 3-oxoacyl-[acyl-carrier-protein] synthase III C-terminal domain-containing protein [Ramlibacter sp.]
MKSRSFGIAGSAVAHPRRSVSSREVDERLGMPHGHVEATFGIRRRQWADPQETSSAMAAAAAAQALAEADWSADTLDVIVGACGVMEQPIPGTAPLVQRRLGLGGSGIRAYDVNATCLSFLVALEHVLDGFALGRWQRALVFTADIASAALDFRDHEASVIFGDGASAFALAADGAHRCRALRIETYADGADLCRLEAGGTRLRPHEDIDGFLAASRFRMNGPGVFRAAGRRLPRFLQTLLGEARTAPHELATIVPHQASAPALEHLKRMLPDGHARTIDIFAEHGNQIATSLPHALHVARTRGRLRTGEQALMVGTSAGISLGGAVFQW